MECKQQNEEYGGVAYVLKIMVLGERSVGKTSIIQRLVHSIFPKRDRVTVTIPSYKLKLLLTSI